MPRRHRAREFGGITILVAGIVIGSLGAVLWESAQTPAGFGAGIRHMLENFNAPAPSAPGGGTAPAASAARPSTTFDFWTHLPGIEVVLPPVTPDEPAESPAPPREGGSRYMLQVASYRSFAEADKLKARLAFAGMKSKVQKVNIQGRGDFYRVRLGPYDTFAQMETAGNALRAAGIKDALRLKIKPR